MKRLSFDFFDSFISCAMFFACICLAIFYGVESKWLTMWAFIVCSLNIVTYLQLKSKNKEQKAALDMSDNRFENLIQAFNTLIQTHIEVTSAHEVVKKELKAMKENHG